MKRMYHPTLPKQFTDVADDQIEAHEEQGWLAGPVLPNEDDEPGTEPDFPVPSGNASRADWHAYALTQGATEDDLEGLSRDDIRATYGA